MVETRYRVVIKRVSVQRPVVCRICVDEKDDDRFCLRRLPEFPYTGDQDAVDERKLQLVAWIEYAAYCLGVESSADVRWLIYD